MSDLFGDHIVGFPRRLIDGQQYMYTKFKIKKDKSSFVKHTIHMKHFCFALFLPTLYLHKMSRIVTKQDFCLCENKGADQLRGNREADQRLCFRYTDSTIPLLLKSEISSF